jgi:hypothetical protein
MLELLFLFFVNTFLGKENNAVYTYSSFYFKYKAKIYLNLKSNFFKPLEII